MDANLLSHQIATLLQELAFPEFQGEAGLSRVMSRLDTGLAKVKSSVGRASLSDFRKLYHEDWKDLMKTLVDHEYHELAADRFKKLVF